MSKHAASAVGKAWDSLAQLYFEGILSKTEHARAVKRLISKAADRGVFISTTGTTGIPLGQGIIRVHWGSARGQQINRYYGDK